MGLPLIVKVHASLAILTGVGLSFFPHYSATNPLVRFLSAKLSVPTEDPQKPLSRTSTQHITTMGILFAAVGAMYLPTWNQERESNKFLYATVPLRLLMAGLTALSMVVRPAGRDVWKTVIVVEDGLGAVALGLMLGRFDGQPPLG